ncbi:MAG: putative toxin-antitoxin system toxin component, PIN family [Acidithiobacillus sp.]
MAPVPRVVLDTNIVLSALVFSQGRVAWLRDAWQRGRLVPIVCHETVTELLRVLAYPKFKLSRADQEELLADFLPFAETVSIQDPPSNLPVCRDAADQIFLVLACQARASALVTGDADLLALRKVSASRILTAEEFKAIIGSKS